MCKCKFKAEEDLAHKKEMTQSSMHSLWILFFRKSFCLELQNALVEIAVRLAESVTGKSVRETG